MHETSSLTPMFQQYRALKTDHPDAILLFRMGDFYEMFHEDARDASRVLDLTLTARGKGTAHVAPMCGFPHHQLDSYVARLVREGRKVAVCEQVEDPKTAKGLVRREVIRIVTPGTVTDPAELDSKSNAWIASISFVAGKTGAAFLDASTGEYLAWQSPDGQDAWESLGDRLGAFLPREIVHPEDLPWPESFRRERTQGAAITSVEPYSFAPDAAADALRRHLGVVSLDGYGLKDRPAATAAAGGLLLYVKETQKSGLEHIDGIGLHEPLRFLSLDPSTRRNLELERSIRDGSRRGSLFDTLDLTLTSPGARLLRAWLLSPLLDRDAIARRLDAVEEMLARSDLRHETRERLRGCHDIERLLARAVNGTGTARDLVALRLSLERLPEIVEALLPVRCGLLRDALDGIDPCADVASRLAQAIVEAPPIGLKEGGIVKDGFDAKLDELRALRRDGRSFIAGLETKEREATGIGSLKVRFNKVFGYYIEISRSNVRLVPDRYHRKQTIATGERYVTPELKEYETKVLRAQDRIEILEYELFQRLRAEVATEARRLKAAATVLALLDVVSALAELASVRGYRRPSVVDGPTLTIVSGRHPVIETLIADPFVPNDTRIEAPGSAIAILTGPNMGGKSTYLRQVAVIVMMAQAGSFVPADEATIGIVDRIFCRVGASDSLAEGQSTFLVEMSETANILHHVTPRSLVLLDEIGRGTSTFDGLAIAWAVVEHLHSCPGGRPRTLFATHYHELTELAVALPGVANLRMAVREWGERVVFLHRVEAGAADRSYGIHVARLAGVPGPVISRAKEILQNLEKDEFGGDGLPRRARSRGRGREARRDAPLFLKQPADEPSPDAIDPAAAEVLAELRERDPDRLTPIEALTLLAAWRRRLTKDP